MSQVQCLYLMRHGEAAWSAPDSERALTARGVEHTRQVLAALGERLPQCQALLSSPYRRARQTMAEVEAVTHLKATRHDFLTPDEAAPQTLRLLGPLLQDVSLVVAHQPLLGNLVSLLTEGHQRLPYPFGTSEVVLLEIDAWAPGGARLIRAWQP